MPTKEEHKSISSTWKFMLRLQGSDDEQMQWLAVHIGRLYEIIGKLKSDVASLKASRTKQAKRRKPHA